MIDIILEWSSQGSYRFSARTEDLDQEFRNLIHERIGEKIKAPTVELEVRRDTGKIPEKGVEFPYLLEFRQDGQYNEEEERITDSDPLHPYFQNITRDGWEGYEPGR